MEHYVLIETTFEGYANNCVYHSCYVFDDLEAARKKLKELYKVYLAEAKEEFDDELSESVTEDEAEIYDEDEGMALIKYEVIRAKQN